MHHTNTRIFCVNKNWEYILFYVCTVCLLRTRMFRIIPRLKLSNQRPRVLGNVISVFPRPTYPQKVDSILCTWYESTGRGRGGVLLCRLNYLLTN